MRSLDILKSEDRLHREAARRDACVNGRYLMVHNVLAQAFTDDLASVSNLDMPEYLSTLLSRQAAQGSCKDAVTENLAA